MFVWIIRVPIILFRIYRKGVSSYLLWHAVADSTWRLKRDWLWFLFFFFFKCGSSLKNMKRDFGCVFL